MADLLDILDKRYFKVEAERDRYKKALETIAKQGCIRNPLQSYSPCAAASFGGTTTSHYCDPCYAELVLEQA